MGEGCCVVVVVMMIVLVAMVVAAVAVAHRETTSDKRQTDRAIVAGRVQALQALSVPSVGPACPPIPHNAPTTHREPIRPDLAHSPSVAIPVLRAAAYCADHTVDDDNAPRSTLRPV
jgi:hypothetical protein